MKRLTVGVFGVVGLAALIGLFQASSGGEKPKKIVAKVVFKGLDNPCGVGVQPEVGHVFVATHSGVVRYDPKANKSKMEISDYPTDIYGKGPKYEIGPLGVAFLDKEHLVVGDGSRVDGSEYVRVYKIGGKLPAKTRKEDSADYTLGPIVPGEQSPKGEGNFYSVAVGADAIFVSCNGDDTKGWVAKALISDIKAGKKDLHPTIATKVATNVDAPVPLTFTPDGKQLVVGQMGEINVPNDSLLCFYDPASGKLNRMLKTELHDLTGLAYSPKTGKLYGTDFAWLDTKQGALYRLDIDGDAVKSTKILALDKPTSIAFDADGLLYIAVIGTAKEGSDKKPGELRYIDAGL